MTVLNYEAFICEIKKQIQEKMGEDARIDIHDTEKNNGVTYKGISVLKKDSNVSPNLRLDDFYQMYLDVGNTEEVSERMIKIFDSNLGKTIDVEGFTNFERAKDRILFKLVSYEANKERLEHMPHTRFLDLAVIYYYYMEQGCLAGGTASIQVEREHLNYWNISEVMLHRLAVENCRKKFPAHLHTMQDVMHRIMKEKGIDPGEFQDEMESMQKQLPMYVLSNAQNYFGAAALYYPGELKKISRQFDTDLLILPSSVHEVIILPFDEDEDCERLNGIIRDINDNQVADEEILSNHLYRYDRQKDKLLIPAAML